MSASHADALSDLRLRLLANGYEPLPISGPGEPVKSAGKRPRLPGWQSVEITPPAVRGWARDFAADTNTGIRCGRIIGVDVDVLSADLARSIEDLALAMLGPTPLRRIGRAPKVLLAYRADGDQPKAETPEFILPDGTKAQVEVLAKGQQFVSHGTHPDTRQAYVWTGQAPEHIAAADLPIAPPARIRAFLAAAESLFRDAGGRTAKEIEAANRPSQEPRPERQAPNGEGGFFREVNARAFANCDAWVKAVFPAAYWQPNATTPPGAWRIASKDLGRGLEEDIAIHTREGIQDFGTRESLTPIDLVIRHIGAPDAPAAAMWLCERLAVDPAAIGWKGKRKAEPQRDSRDKPAQSDNPTQLTDGGQPRVLPLIFWQNVQPATAGSDFVEGLLIEGAMSVLYGPSNCGKTFYATDLALHVATGRKWKGREIDAGAVIYCALEGSHGIRNRVAAWRMEQRLDGIEVPFAIIPVALDLLDPSAHTQPLIDTIQHVAREMGIPVKLVVLDTLSRAMAGGNENSPEDMGALVTNGTKVQQATGAHVMWVHHSGKDQAQGARGHSLLRAATDTEIEISRPDKDSPSTARVTKQRELEIAGEWTFTLRAVTLGTDRRGKPVTSCVVEDAEPAESKASSGMSGGARFGLTCLFEAVTTHGKPPANRDIPQWARVVTLEQWRTEFYARSHLDKPEAKRQAFHRAIKDLRAINKVGVLHDLAWLADER
jgi:hypothetical protein